jgi:hypothetical protein
VTICHPRTGVLHHVSDPVPHVGFIAVYPAVGAGGFSLLKWAFVETPVCILKQRSAILAKSLSSLMHATAIDYYHGLNCFSLFCYSPVFHNPENLLNMNSGRHMAGKNLVAAPLWAQNIIIGLHDCYYIRFDSKQPNSALSSFLWTYVCRIILLSKVCKGTVRKFFRHLCFLSRRAWLRLAVINELNMEVKILSL